MKWQGGFDFRKAQARITEGLESGVRALADDIFDESQALVPNDPETGSGDLKASGRVETAVGAAKVEAQISYGTGHAVIQHERLDYHHDSGEAAKFLERPLSAAQRSGGSTVAARVRKALS